MCCHDNHTQMHIHNPKHFSATTVSLSVKKSNISRARLLLTPWKENDWKQNLYKRLFLTPNCVRIWTPFYSGLHLFVAIIWSTLWFGSQITHSYSWWLQALVKVTAGNAGNSVGVLWDGGTQSQPSNWKFSKEQSNGFCSLSQWVTLALLHCNVKKKKVHKGAAGLLKMDLS